MSRRDRVKEAACIGLYQAGAKLVEIGDALGISRERVRQIMNQAGYERDRCRTYHRVRFLRQR